MLRDLHARPGAEAVPAGLAPYDLEALLREADLLVDWWVPARLGESALDPAARSAWTEAWDAVLPAVLARPATLVVRDFHVDNLMRLDGRPGVAACGLLDFQDALAGAPEYDLMSLLEDARRDLDPTLVARMLARYGDYDADAYAVLAAQRHAKVVGIFTRLKVRDGKDTYLKHIPRVWGLLERALEEPVLAPVRAWFDARIPKRERGTPHCR